MQGELDALKKRLFRDNQIRNVKFFPGRDTDATPEDMARAINMFFADPKPGRRFSLAVGVLLSPSVVSTHVERLLARGVALQNRLHAIRRARQEFQ